MAKKRGKAAGRVYARLTRHERNTLELMLGERAGKTRLFCCDPMRSDQKGACEKNHVETRRLLSKGRGISLDRLAPEDCAGHVPLRAATLTARFMAYGPLVWTKWAALAPSRPSPAIYACAAR